VPFVHKLYIYLLSDVLWEGVQLLVNVLGEGLDKKGVCRPTVND
jgi:hypothetical protein